MTSQVNISNEAADVSTPQQFELLYREYAPFLLRVSYKFCEDEALAADMVQEIFCSLWDRRETIRVTGPWENYLYRCARYQFLNHCRSLEQHRILQKEWIGSNLPDHHTEEKITYQDLLDNVNSLVDQLPDQCKKVYQLSRNKGLRTAEISMQMALSEKTVKNHLTRALGFLRKNMGELFILLITLG